MHGRGESEWDKKVYKRQTGGWLGKEHITYLMCSGERWEESTRRSTYVEWDIDTSLTTRKRTVYRWRPMLAFETADIWSVIKENKLEAHEAYQLGCDRLGCTMCIFAGDCGRMAKDVKISCKNNPEQYEELDRLEAETGYTMSIQGVRVRDIVNKG